MLSRLSDSARARWAAARSELDGLPGGTGLNIAHEAVDRHAAGPLASKVAIRWLAKKGGATDLTFADLASATARFANVLEGLGVAPGERVFVLTGRVPELYVAVLGALKHRNVACTLFAAFGPEPVRQRMALGDAAVLVTTLAHYERKVLPGRAELPSLRHVLLVGDGAADGPEGTVDLAGLLDRASQDWVIPPTDPEDPALLHFTSGTTGLPKGALHAHGAVVAHHATAAAALGLRRDDVFWCTADPGWVTGTSYGIIAPLTHGVTSIVDEGDLDADRWYGILQDEKVTVWYTAPTAIRMLMRVGADVAHEYDLSSLRVAASVGEPLNPEAVVWGTDALGMPFRDNWWQTETGGIMIANTPEMSVRPGSMGRPLPGIEAGLLRCDDEGHLTLVGGNPVEVTEPDETGLLALRPGWPSMFRAYLHNEEKYRSCFTDGWYLSGDLARRDADGYFWFVGRADDVIKTAGHLIGPFEVENALMEHEAVAEAGAYGVPDPVAGAVVHAMVALKAGFGESEALRKEILGAARARLGPAVAPRVVLFGPVPKTKSGKILRRLLRARELGLPEGDLSTLEPAP